MFVNHLSHIYGFDADRDMCRVIKIEVSGQTKCSSFRVETCAATMFLIICAIDQRTGRTKYSFM